MTDHVNLLELIAADYTMPKGYDRWLIRSVRPDLRSSRGFRWPYPGGVARADGPFEADNSGGCPSDVGDGICAATNWAGMSSGCIPAVTLLLVAVKTGDILGHEEGESKLRFKAAKVVDVIDGTQLLKERGANADLRSANLRLADLSSADLSQADLSQADLSSANLRLANLRSANLRLADLRSANLRSADLRQADLSSANLRLADLSSANLRLANLRSADLRSANLRLADLSSADLSLADLSSADLSLADLRSAPRGNANTHLPSGWSVNSDGLIVPD